MKIPGPELYESIQIKPHSDNNTTFNFLIRSQIHIQQRTTVQHNPEFYIEFPAE